MNTPKLYEVEVAVRVSRKRGARRQFKAHVWIALDTGACTAGEQVMRKYPGNTLTHRYELIGVSELAETCVRTI